MAKESYSDLLNPKPIGRDRWRISLAGLLGISDSQWGAPRLLAAFPRDKKRRNNLPSQLHQFAKPKQ